MSVAITIVGLGPGEARHLTLEAWRALESAPEVYLRTRRHPVVAELPAGPAYHSFDDLYERLDTLDQVYDEIADRVLALGARPLGVVYAVPGHPLVGESSVLRILAGARERGISVQVLAGLSFLEPALTALGIDALGGLQICDAVALAARHHPNLDPDVGAIVAQVDSRRLAADVKMTLLNLYPDEHPVRLVRGAGTSDERVRDLPLFELDRQDDLDHLTSFYLPPLARPGSVATFQDVVARLRAPDGCPWDREQTHESLRTSLLEETYEVLAALDADDMGDLCGELGDLLLQIIFHAQIAVEDGDFRLVDTIAETVEKLIRRHPHVFADDDVADADDVLRHWEQIKRAERAARGESEFTSMLAGINKALPALSQATEMQRRVARVGFDWQQTEDVSAKVAEEVGEYLAADGEAERTAEFGDLLFSLVNLARWTSIDAESALREASARFARRFAAIEQHAQEAGTPLEEMTLDEMDALWEQAKRGER